MSSHEENLTSQPGSPAPAGPLYGEEQMPEKLSREDETKLILENTVITRAQAWVVTLCFLLTIFSVPVLQQFLEVRSNLEARQQEVSDGLDPEGRILPQSFDVFGVLPTSDEIKAAEGPQEAWELIPKANELADFEAALEDISFVAAWLLPRVQPLLARIGVGNEQAYLGREVNGERWLMYRPDVDYLLSRGFLDPGLLKVRRRAGDASEEAVQPDPIKAIVDFKEQLQRRGIELILMPTPVKPMVHPETMSARYDASSGLVQNPSYDEFLSEMNKADVKVFDIGTLLVGRKKTNGAAQFLATDTHWSPDAMEAAAQQLAQYIQMDISLTSQAPAGYTRSEKSVEHLGDIFEMLKLPETQTMFRPQRVTIYPISDTNGELWYYDKEADILLLGDSFSNIFSLPDMGWGDSAGFVEQLSFYLQRPLDTIINNAGGSHVTRQSLAAEIARGNDRLKGKKVVIWQFAMRDLLSGDWKLINLG